ncbi:response regulator transcription factor [Hoeflea sp. G2-23]|uniref:Response regulator transcription factor n=1 Tax=Hoeflea algicola TaxID=2983763 RepID=A0ABT3Z7C0_9HYPH|nr:response regulator transcription factor [Hoeflea algicola]MCY0147647.1 response regulator transcription factor [Hoeflea algicola]
MKQILIVEDVAETRNWLSNVAHAAFPDCTTIMTDSLRAGRAAVSRCVFDLALIDLGLPDGNGLDLLSDIRQSGAPTLGVVTTAMADDANIVAALSRGASGYLLKEQPAERIVQQLTQLAEGIPALSPSIARRIMEHFRLTGPVVDETSTLTARECEVLALISRGLRNVDVAETLGLSENTIASHLKSIYRKLGISSRAEASWHATRMGLAPGD